jgi:hypothetical protein
MRVKPSREPCDDCGGEGDVLLYQSDLWEAASIALCSQCRIKLEALLRASRKAGPRVRNWEVRS